MNKTAFIVLLCLLCFSCIPPTPKGNSTVSVAGNGKAEYVNLELPAIKTNEIIVRHTAYTASFNSLWKIPNWVAYELTPAKANGVTPRPNNSPFCEDPDYRGIQPRRSDYHNDSEWDKGHMAPCADMKLSNETMMESFYFTNVCPQNRSINAGDWQSLESLIHKMAAQKGRTVYVICGPIVKQNQYGTLGEARIVIPDYFFKAVLFEDERGYHSIGFVLPNKASSKPLRDYAIPVNDLEEIIGIDLFAGLDRNIQETVESQFANSDWGL